MEGILAHKPSLVACAPKELLHVYLYKSSASLRILHKTELLWERLPRLHNQLKVLTEENLELYNSRKRICGI